VSLSSVTEVHITVRRVFAISCCIFRRLLSPAEAVTMVTAAAAAEIQVNDRRTQLVDGEASCETDRAHAGCQCEVAADAAVDDVEPVTS